MEKILVADNRYDGKYIALKSSQDNTVVGSGENPQEALDEAKEKGVVNPFLFYVPDKDMIQIY